MSKSNASTISGYTTENYSAEMFCPDWCAVPSEHPSPSELEPDVFVHTSLPVRIPGPGSARVWFEMADYSDVSTAVVPVSQLNRTDIRLELEEGGLEAASARELGRRLIQMADLLDRENEKSREK